MEDLIKNFIKKEQKTRVKSYSLIVDRLVSAHRLSDYVLNVVLQIRPVNFFVYFVDD